MAQLLRTHLWFYDPADIRTSNELAQGKLIYAKPIDHLPDSIVKKMEGSALGDFTDIK